MRDQQTAAEEFDELDAALWGVREHGHAATLAYAKRLATGRRPTEKGAGFWRRVVTILETQVRPAPPQT